MSDDVFTEVSHQNWFSRIGGAIVGVLIGAVFLVVAFALLFWNEGRAVHRASDIGEFAAAAVTIDPAAPSAATDGRPVHFTGQAVGAPLADPVFDVRRDGIHLRRVVEMYQWDETKTTRKRKKAFGGGEETITEYKYKTVWSEKLIDSGRFNSSYRAGHENPRAMRVEAATFTAPQVMVGAFTLPKFLADEIDNHQPVPVADEAVAALPADLKAGAAVRDGKVYLPAGGASAWAETADPSYPRVGDCRVSFTAVPAGPVSVVAVQRGNTLERFQAGHGDVCRAEPGTHSLQQMVATLNRENSVLTWVLRAVGCLVMFVSLVLVLNPLKVLADVVGLVGDIVGAGVFVVALAGALVLSTGTIAVAWVFYRPALGLGLFLVMAGGIWWLNRLKRKGHAQYAARHRGPMAPPVPAYTAGAYAGAAYPGVAYAGGAYTGGPMPAIAGVPGVPADLPPGGGMTMSPPIPSAYPDMPSVPAYGAPSDPPPLPVGAPPPIGVLPPIPSRRTL